MHGADRTSPIIPAPSSVVSSASRAASIPPVHATDAADHSGIASAHSPSTGDASNPTVVGSVLPSYEARNGPLSRASPAVGEGASSVSSLCTSTRRTLVLPPHVPLVQGNRTIGHSSSPHPNSSTPTPRISPAATQSHYRGCNLTAATDLEQSTGSEDSTVYTEEQEGTV